MMNRCVVCGYVVWRKFKQEGTEYWHPYARWLIENYPIHRQRVSVLEDAYCEGTIAAANIRDGIDDSLQLAVLGESFPESFLEDRK